MRLVELAQKWKDGKISSEETLKEFNKITVFKPIEEDDEDECYYTAGNGNSWLEVETDTNLTRAERIDFKRVLRLIK